MLERFKVPTKDQVFVGEAALRKTVAEIFLKMGLTHDDAAEGAEVLTVTDLRGVETHGVSNMLRQYVRDYKAKKLDPRPGWKMVREAPGIILILAYLLLLPPLLAKTILRPFFVKMGFVRFFLLVTLIQFMALLPIKMVLRWTANLKYIVFIPEIFFNI